MAGTRGWGLSFPGGPGSKRALWGSPAPAPAPASQPAHQHGPEFHAAGELLAAAETQGLPQVLLTGLGDPWGGHGGGQGLAPGSEAEGREGRGSARRQPRAPHESWHLDGGGTQVPKGPVTRPSPELD